MDHGFTREHFDLLRRWQGHHFDASDRGKVHAYARLKEAYLATEAWAAALQNRLFPLGRMDIRKAPINQGHAFSRYTWARIYPAPSSPKELAFTVGIDTDGFIVKVDTVGNPPVRPAYEALRGPSNEGSPFAEILSISNGLKLSFEQLVEWSAEAISNFRMGYEGVLQHIGLKVPKLTLITDDATSRGAFAEWRQCLVDGAVRKGSLFWVLEGGIVMRPKRSGRAPDQDGMELGIDPTGRSWAVQINEPRIAGDHNSLSAIAIDAGGERFLLRQGFLRPNVPGGFTISGTEFVSRTGLPPAPVEAEGLAARRLWFRVCSLDSGTEEMRRATSRFVDRCAAARISAEAEEAPIDTSPADMFSPGESGGSYKRRARSAEEERTIVRQHGAVWLALAEFITSAGLRVRKGRHPLGYEVDAEIDGGSAPPLLVEIKTATSADDIHAGVGQLHLYPRLIPRLTRFQRALLLPVLPPPEVRAAVEACGISVHTFDLDERQGEAAVTFSDDFLRCCGVLPEC